MSKQESGFTSAELVFGAIMFLGISATTVFEFLNYGDQLAQTLLAAG
jgi:hypothetical protein